MSVDAKSFAGPQFRTGRFTSAGSPADVTETLGFQPTLTIVFIGTGETNPNMLVKAASDTDETMLTTGSTGVITSPADASGIVLTTTGFTVPAGVQVASATNSWIAFR